MKDERMVDPVPKTVLFAPLAYHRKAKTVVPRMRRGSAEREPKKPRELSNAFLRCRGINTAFWGPSPCLIRLGRVLIIQPRAPSSNYSVQPTHGFITDMRWLGNNTFLLPNLIYFYKNRPRAFSLQRFREVLLELQADGRRRAGS